MRSCRELARELEGENELICFNPLTGEDIPYMYLSDTNKYFYDLHKEIVEILKNIPEAEVIEYEDYDGDDEDGQIKWTIYWCGNCKEEVPRKAEYCPKCGRRLKW